MKRVHRLSAGLTCSLAVAQAFAGEPSPPPPSIQDSTAIRIVVARCKRAPEKTIEVQDLTQVKKLAAEMAQVRKPTGIAAAKYACSTEVSFLKSAQPLAVVQVFPCSAMEQAPVSGKRYFQYASGFNQLPELSLLVKNLGQGVECR
ncbi:MAG: hypothetical protein KF892_24255 [Rhizobacter sp.]|nr:hypothetical protein [Rhizobacter sp.]